jgi:hypothetical protein
MKKEIRGQWNKFVKWCKETDEEKEREREEKEYNDFIKKVEKRMDKISVAQKATTHEGRAQVALMFENAYTQKKITEANKTMGNATIVLAIATIALVITEAYGIFGLENTIIELIMGFVGIIIIVVILWVIRAFAWIIKRTFRLFG